MQFHEGGSCRFCLPLHPHYLEENEYLFEERITICPRANPKGEVPAGREGVVHGVFASGTILGAVRHGVT